MAALFYWSGDGVDIMYIHSTTIKQATIEQVHEKQMVKYRDYCMPIFLSINAQKHTSVSKTWICRTCYMTLHWQCVVSPISCYSHTPTSLYIHIFMYMQSYLKSQYPKRDPLWSFSRFYLLRIILKINEKYPCFSWAVIVIFWKEHMLFPGISSAPWMPFTFCLNCSPLFP